MRCRRSKLGNCCCHSIRAIDCHNCSSGIVSYDPLNSGLVCSMEVQVVVIASGALCTILCTIIAVVICITSASTINNVLHFTRNCWTSIHHQTTHFHACGCSELDALTTIRVQNIRWIVDTSLRWNSQAPVFIKGATCQWLSHVLGNGNRIVGHTKRGCQCVQLSRNIIKICAPTRSRLSFLSVMSISRPVGR